MLAFFTLLLLTGIYPPFLQANDTNDPPNFVLILADDLGFSDLGCYGSEISTPNLDKLAANGLRFSQFYNTARCWPTRACLLTGYYAQQIRRDAIPGFKGRPEQRPEWAKTLASMLKVHSYRGYHSGKWHLDGQPVAEGFDLSYRLADHGRYFSPRRHFHNGKTLPPVERGDGYYATTAIADHAIECLQSHQKEYSESPFFSFIAFTAPHFPLHALPNDIERYRGKYDLGWDEIRQQRWERIQELGYLTTSLSDVERDRGPPYDFPSQLEQLGNDEVNKPIAWSDLTPEQKKFQATKMEIHAAMVDRMDREIGRIIEQLEKMSVQDNTLVMFLSDNGASAEIMVRDDGHDPTAAPGSAATHLCLGPGWSTFCNTPFRRHKTWVHEGGVSTPFIASWPNKIKQPGMWCKQPSHVIDVAATILDCAGIEFTTDMPGQPAFAGESFQSAFTNLNQYRFPRTIWFSHDGHRALRRGDWKVVSEKDGPWELYELSQDRAEAQDISASNPDRVRELSELWTWQADEFARQAGRVKID